MKEFIIETDKHIPKSEDGEALYTLNFSQFFKLVQRANESLGKVDIKNNTPVFILDLDGEKELAITVKDLVWMKPNEVFENGCIGIITDDIDLGEEEEASDAS